MTGFVEWLSDSLVAPAYAYDTNEHIASVDAACKRYLSGRVLQVDVGGSKFTLGEVSALAGDFFGSPNELVNAAADARAYLDSHREAFDAGQVSMQDAIKLTRGTFMDLAIVNFEHFRSGGPGRNALAACKRYHEEALAHAGRKTGAAPGKGLAAALLHEGFALHFLLDLFASGHLRTPRAAVCRHLEDGLGYPRRNAEIVGALLSGRQHDDENREGLACAYVATGDLKRGGVVPLRKGRFYGDDTLKNTAPPERDHLEQVIFSQLTHLFPLLRLVRSKREVDPSPWTALDNVVALYEGRRTELLQDVSYDDFLDACTPTPLDADNPDDAGCARMTVEGGSGTPRVRWHGPETFDSFGVFQVHVGCSADQVIDRVTLKIPRVLVAPAWVAVAGEMIAFEEASFRAPPVTGAILAAGVELDGSAPGLVRAFERTKGLAQAVPFSLF